MSEQKFVIDTVMPPGWEKIDRLEVTEKTNDNEEVQRAFTGVIELGDPENPLIRRVTQLPDFLEMRGEDSKEWEKYKANPEMWHINDLSRQLQEEKQKNAELEKRLERLEALLPATAGAIASQQTELPETANINEVTPAAEPEVALEEPQPEAAETAVAVAEARPLPLQTEETVIKPIAEPAPVVVEKHPIEPVIEEPEPTVQAQLTPEETADELEEAAALRDQSYYNHGHRDGYVQATRERRRWYREPVTWISTVAAIGAVAAAGLAFWNHRETEELERGLATIEQSINNNDNHTGGSNITEINGVTISELGTSTNFYSKDPHKRLTGVVLPKRATIRYNSDGTDSLVDGGTVLIKTVEWDQQGNLSRADRQHLTAKNYYLIQGKLGNRRQTIVNKR